MNPATGLSFLPTVTQHGFAHTSEALALGKTKQLFDGFRQRFDYVLVDLSPLAPVVDVRATSHFIDSYLFVIEWGQTTVPAVQTALAGAKAVGERLLGVVLNKADLRVLNRYEAHKSGNYYARYQEKYGYGQS